MHTGTEAAGKTLELLVLPMLGSMLTIPGLRAPGLAVGSSRPCYCS